MRLSGLNKGQSGVISQLQPSSIQLKLLEMGFIPGIKVSVEHIAPFGDPILVRVSESLVSLRLNEAETITVDIL